MKYFLILNPGSGACKSKKKFDRIFSILDASAIQYSYKITEKLEDAYTFSLQANKENYNRIIAVGGDGTINNAINGFYDREGKKISDAAFGVIYTGTSPDFCKSYNIPIQLDAALKTILNPKTQNIKIGRIVLCKSSGITEVSLPDENDSMVKYFGCCVNIGLGATLARRANSGIRKYLGDFLGTFSALISTIAWYKPVNYNCKFNDEGKTVQKCYNLSVGITPLIASGIKVPKKADCTNLFYVMGACNFKWSNVIGVLKKIYSGKPFKNDDSLWIDYVRTFAVLVNTYNSEVEYDGDPAGYTPCSISFAEEDLGILSGTGE
jgi:diacylglycerol kinase family enzyme